MILLYVQPVPASKLSADQFDLELLMDDMLSWSAGWIERRYLRCRLANGSKDGFTITICKVEVTDNWTNCKKMRTWCLWTLDESFMLAWQYWRESFRVVPIFTSLWITSLTNYPRSTGLLELKKSTSDILSTLVHICCVCLVGLLLAVLNVMEISGTCSA